MAAESPCHYCGAVLSLAQLVRLDKDGEYVYACADCAVATRDERAPVGR